MLIRLVALLVFLCSSIMSIGYFGANKNGPAVIAAAVALSALGALSTRSSNKNVAHSKATLPAFDEEEYQQAIRDGDAADQDDDDNHVKNWDGVARFYTKVEELGYINDVVFGRSKVISEIQLGEQLVIARDGRKKIGVWTQSGKRVGSLTPFRSEMVMKHVRSGRRYKATVETLRMYKSEKRGVRNLYIAITPAR